MPIYEFQCTKCGQPSEKLCKMNESGEDMVCPRCGKSPFNAWYPLLPVPESGAGRMDAAAAKAAIVPVVTKPVLYLPQEHGV